MRRARKKLRCVKIHELLSVCFNDGSGETCLATEHAKRAHPQQNKQQGKPTSDRIHANSQLKETYPKQTLDLQQVKDATSVTHSDPTRDQQYDSENPNEQKRQTVTVEPLKQCDHGNEEAASSIPDGRPPRGRRREPDSRETIHREICIQGSTWCSESPSMGTGNAREWEVSGDLRRRSGLRDIYGHQPTADGSGPQELSELCHGPQEEDAGDPEQSRTHLSSISKEGKPRSRTIRIQLESCGSEDFNVSRLSSPPTSHQNRDMNPERMSGEPSMQIEVDAQRVQELQTQMAIIQRELNRLGQTSHPQP